VAHCEARYLGIWTPLNVEVTDFTDKNTLGCYVDQNYTIYISEDHLKNSEAQAVLSTILHESYHAYSHRMVDLYKSSDGKMKNLLPFKETQKYAEEFENYTDSSENVTEYAVQQCEVDARRYARSGIEEYYSLIDQFLKAQKE
jgi:predicted SprT family Zn-dependent metalloprotease